MKFFIVWDIGFIKEKIMRYFCDGDNGKLEYYRFPQGILVCSPSVRLDEEVKGSWLGNRRA